MKQITQVWLSFPQKSLGLMYGQDRWQLIGSLKSFLYLYTLGQSVPRPHLYRARGSRTRGVRDSTVSMLWANTSRPEDAMVATLSLLPPKSGTKHSTRMEGFLGHKRDACQNTEIKDNRKIFAFAKRNNYYYSTSAKCM